MSAARLGVTTGLVGLALWSGLPDNPAPAPPHAAATQRPTIVAPQAAAYTNPAAPSFVPITRFDPRPTFLERNALALSVAPVNPETGLSIDGSALEWLPAGFRLRAGDRVLKINGDPVASTSQLVEAVRGASEGSAVELSVKRSDSLEPESYWARL